MSDTLEKAKVTGFGLITIGSEIMDGRVTDKHFVTLRDLLKERHLRFAYALTIPDVPELIDEQLVWAMARAEPFFCCGGIGATPDDFTRDCAARAACVDVEPHAEGLALLKARYGPMMNDNRLRLVTFPVGSTLVPNPVNQVPGFRIRNGHFLPGFPRMAAPMMAWVLDHWYEAGAPRTSHTLVLPNGREGDLVPLMQTFIDNHPRLSFSSLPRFVEGGTELRLGISGPPEDVEAGAHELAAALTAEGVDYRVADAGA